MLMRAKFSKKKRLRYISHLQLLDTFRRAIRRAKLPGKYSEGYNPSLNLSLSQPLPVGMPGGGEYLDLELTKAIDSAEFCQRLQGALPAGIEIIASRFTTEKLKSLQAIVDRARYIINPLKDNKDRAKEVLARFREKDKLLVIRERRKKKNRQYDLRNMVHDMSITENGCFSFLVSTGSRGNVRPEEIIKGLQKIDITIEDQPLVNFYREGLYISGYPKLLTPLADEIMEGE